MLKSVMRGTIASVCLALSSSVHSKVDCVPLDPRASVSKETEVKVRGSVATLYKIAKADGSMEVRTRAEIENLLAGAPALYREQIKLRTLYLFCELVANASDITTERKVELYLMMMKVKDEPTS